MFEKIKAWIKRKRETAREQQAADRLIKHIEQALGFELYEWQRLYIITAEQFRKSYDALKMRLSLSAEYNTAPQVSETDTNSTESGV